MKKMLTASMLVALFLMASAGFSGAQPAAVKLNVNLDQPQIVMTAECPRVVGLPPG